jgi:hypothetical protein
MRIPSWPSSGEEAELRCKGGRAGAGGPMKRRLSSAMAELPSCFYHARAWVGGDKLGRGCGIGHRGYTA